AAAAFLFRLTGLPGRPLSTYVPSLSGLTCLLFFPFPVYLPRSPRRPLSAARALSSPASFDGQVSKTISHASRLCQAFSRCFSAFFFNKLKTFFSRPSFFEGEKKITHLSKNVK
ncbi:MAG: hypothetical protein PUF61_01995, partial [Spirochaetales bacterium]|nr:hypothetical protein [Spirochaetales bacterium]